MPLNLPLDEKLAESINRRRIAEELRKKRIFNPKERMIGIDVEALNHQIHENNLSRLREAEIENYFADESKRQSHLAKLLEQKLNEEVSGLCKEIDRFRLNEQRPENRRDYDLYDPNLLKKERPPRISDTQLCPVSGLQKLDGEDLDFKERTANQKEQVRDLLTQQMQEKRMKNCMKGKEQSDWESMLLKQDQKALQVARAEEDDKRTADKIVKDSNKYLALQAAAREMQTKANEDHEKIKDIQAQFYGDMLTENPLVARSALGPHRVVPDRWKGMSREQLIEYHEGRLRQMAENKRQKDETNRESEEWSRQVKMQARLAKLSEIEEERQRSKNEKEIAMENLRLAQEQKMQKDFFNRVVCSNVPSEKYFTQFNTTTR